MMMLSLTSSAYCDIIMTSSPRNNSCMEYNTHTDNSSLWNLLNSDLSFHFYWLFFIWFMSERYLMPSVHSLFIDTSDIYLLIILSLFLFFISVQHIYHKWPKSYCYFSHYKSEYVIYIFRFHNESLHRQVSKRPIQILGKRWNERRKKGI